LRARELVEVGRDLFGLATEIDGLPDERAGQAQVGIGGTDLVRVAVCESRYAVRLRKAKALVDFRIDPDLGTLPQLAPDIECCIPSLSPGIGIETVDAVIRRMKW
jgi:hypothetical protein